MDRLGAGGGGDWSMHETRGADSCLCRKSVRKISNSISAAWIGQEMFWGSLRQKLRTLDLHDLRLKRPPLSRMAYTARVKSVLKSQKAQAVASSYAGRFRRTCQ